MVVGGNGESCLIPFPFLFPFFLFGFGEPNNKSCPHIIAPSGRLQSSNLAGNDEHQCANEWFELGYGKCKLESK